MKQQSIIALPVQAGIQSHKEIMSRPPRMPGHDGTNVIPAKAGIHGAASRITDKWIPDQVRDDSIYFSAISAYPSPPSSPYDSEKGNALFLILIAVALFAALSYAITQSSRGGAGIDREQTALGAAELVQYAALIEQSYMRLRLSGCDIANIDFSSDLFYHTLAGDAANRPNANAAGGETCHLFKPNGGGVVPKVAPASTLDLSHTLTSGNVLPGHVFFRAIQMKGIGTDGPAGTESANDIMLNITFITRAACLLINENLGVENPGGNPPVITVTGTANGTIFNGSMAGGGIFEGADINGKAAYCGDTGLGIYGYRQAIHAR